MKKTLFIKNALILTVSSLILRFVGIIFKVWLAKLIGSEGIGLYQLVFSVYMLASTFAASGICTAVTRLIAEELAVGTKKGAAKIMRRSVELTLIIALATVITVFFGAEFIASRFLGDIRAVPALKILPLSLPFMGITSCLRGYFIAIWLFDTKKLKITASNSRPPQPVVKRIFHIALPITSGRYLNTALRTAENILVPKNLAKYPFGGNNALSQFGMIKGMALPILFFPSTLLNSVSTLLIPEISEASAKNQKGLVRSATQNVLKLTALVSFIFAAVFFCAGREIGMLLYKDRAVGELLRALSPIVPLMYLDSISDGILKGLDQQAFSFRTAISDSVIRIFLILILLPIFGLRGFIWIMYFSNALTCGLNVGRLLKVSRARLYFVKEVFLPLGCAYIIVLTAETLLKKIVTGNLVYIILICVISLPVYLVFLMLFGVLNHDDIRNFTKKH